MDDRLDMRIKAGAIDTANRYAPWRPDIAWWIVAIQGAISLAIGIWLFFNQGADNQIIQLLGLFVLAVSAAWAWSAMRSELPQVVLGWRGLRGGVGLAVGVLVTIDIFTSYILTPVALTILSVGLALVGILGIVEWFVGREAMGWRWPSLVGPVVALVYGAILLASRIQQGVLFLQVIAAAAVIGGVLLLLRAALVWREAQLARLGPSTVSTEASSVRVPVQQASVAPGPGTAAPAVTVRSAGSAQGSEAGHTPSAGSSPTPPGDVPPV